MGAIDIKCFQGDPWSPSGIGDGTTSIMYSVVNETFTVTEDTNTIRLWFAGKGSGSALVYTAYVTQGAKSVPVSVGGKFSAFTIPSSGRWSDWVSVADFTLPGEVVFVVNYVEAVSLPTFSDNSVPTDPVPVSAVEGATQLPISSSTPSNPGCTLISDGFTSNQGWYNFGTPTEGFAHTIADGKMKISGAGIGNITTRRTGYFPIVPTYNRLSYELDITINKIPTANWTYYTGNGTYADAYAYLQLFCDKYHAGAVLRFTNVGVYTNYLNESYEYMPLKIADANSSYHIKVMWDGTVSCPYCSIYINDALCYTVSVPVYHATYFFLQYITFQASVADAGESIDFDIDNFVFKGDMGLPQAGTIPSAPSVLTETPYTGTISVSTNPSSGDTATITNSATTVFTFVDHYPVKTGEVQIGATREETANNLATAINNIAGVEFVATVSGYKITVKAYTETEFSVATTSGGITASVTGIVSGLITESISVSDEFTATLTTKYVGENATAAGSTDGLIDGLSESASATTSIDCLTDSMDESVNCDVSVNVDGLIEYMGEEI
jgi:hypothetical protein